MRKQRIDLKGADEPAFHALLGWQGCNVGAVEHDAAGIRTQHAGYQIDQRRLACAVRADHADDAAARQLERQVLDQQAIAERLVDAVEHDDLGRFAGQRDAIFETWKHDIAAIAKCPNVIAKLGGLAMPDNGFGWDKRDRPATSDELVAAQARYYHHTIECFGPSRCMFESNFPVDRRSLPYASYWNAMKNIAALFSAYEQHAMFYGTAQRIYLL